MAAARRQGMLEKPGEGCFVCTMDLGIESDHVRGRAVDEEQRPLCGTCHNLKTRGDIIWDDESRQYAPNLGKAYYLTAPLCPQPPHSVQMQLLGFWRTLGDLWEVRDAGRLTLYHDPADGAFFTECHLTARQIEMFVDLEPALHGRATEDLPVEKLVKLTRDVVEESPVFKDMQRDARKGRPFSDIVVEWNTSYRPDRPLKVIGGQHRTWSIRMAIDSDSQADRLHGVKTYLALDGDKRSSLCIVFNRNIPVAKPYLDRLVEHRVVGANSMLWARHVGLLGEDEDFADRVTGTRRLTAQIVWCVVTNYFLGGGFKGKVDDSLHEAVHIPKTGTGGLDKKYMRVLEEHRGLWSSGEVLEMGRRFAELHRRQADACFKPPDKFRDLRKVQHRYKALTPCLAAAWGYTAGVLQREQKRLKAHYELPGSYDPKASPDPLNALAMSAQKHWSEKETYRGLGTRQNAKEAQRLVKLFLLQTLPDYRGGISKELIASAMDEHAVKMKAVEAERKRERAKRVAKRFKGPAEAD
jgi:hypothetical protein